MFKNTQLSGMVFLNIIIIMIESCQKTILRNYELYFNTNLRNCTEVEDRLVLNITHELHNVQ